MISMGSFDMSGTATPESTSAAAIFLTKIEARLL
jgi:hypothetical protein